LIIPDANATINFNTSLIQIKFNKPLNVTTKYISFGLSINKKNIKKRLPYLQMDINNLEINITY